MALGQLNLRVSQKDFEERITVISMRMQALEDVVARYGRAKENLDQFIESGDDNYEAMCAQIDEYVNNAKRAHAALNETKIQLQETVNQMANMGSEVKETITSATDAVKSTAEAAIKINSIL